MVSQYSCAAAITGRNPIIDVLIRADGHPSVPISSAAHLEGLAVAAHLPSKLGAGEGDRGTSVTKRVYRILYLLEGVPVTVCAVATVAWEGSPGVAVFG